MRVVARTDLTIRDLTEVPQPINPEDPRLTMAEKELQEAVVELAQHLGYLVYHTHNSQRSAAGWPDLAICPDPDSSRSQARPTLFVELKSTKGKVTQAQATWLKALAATGLHVYVWRPYDWITGGVERILRGPRERV